LRWKDLVQPAIDIAKNGFSIGKPVYETAEELQQDLTEDPGLRFVARLSCILVLIFQKSILKHFKMDDAKQMYKTLGELILTGFALLLEFLENSWNFKNFF
jgi:gamma-glutamyltranspeptidase